jgi:hypothetical protein
LSSFSLLEKAREKQKIALAKPIQPTEEIFWNNVTMYFGITLSGF